MNKETNTKTTPRIYVACLASYNAGRLHGEWIDADQDAEAIAKAVQAMLKASPDPNIMMQDWECECGHAWGVQLGPIITELPKCPECAGKGAAKASGAAYRTAEEWAIHDYDGFEGVRIAEGESLERVAELAAALEEHGPAIAAWLARGHEIDGFEDAYAGEWPDLTAFVCEHTEDTGQEVPEWLQYYIDWDSMAHDWECNGDVFTEDSDGGVFVFWNR